MRARQAYGSFVSGPHGTSIVDVTSLKAGDETQYLAINADEIAFTRFVERLLVVMERGELLPHGFLVFAPDLSQFDHLVPSNSGAILFICAFDRPHRSYLKPCLDGFTSNPIGSKIARSCLVTDGTTSFGSVLGA